MVDGWRVREPSLLDFEEPPGRTRAFGELCRSKAGGRFRIPEFYVWTDKAGVVGWVPTWGRVLLAVVNGMVEGPKDGGTFGWGGRKGFGVRMPPDFIFEGDLAVWELSGGDGFLLVCPRVVPFEEGERG